MPVVKYCLKIWLTAAVALVVTVVMFEGSDVQAAISNQPDHRQEGKSPAGSIIDNLQQQ